MSKLKTMTPIASVLVLSLSTVACAEPAKATKPVALPAKPTMPMEGKCGSSMKMDPNTTVRVH